MKSYIELNTKLRPNAKNEFEKDFFKLMNNSVFGKTMENIRNRVKIELVNNKKKAEKLISKPDFVHATIFGDNLISIRRKTGNIKFNKPFYCGMVIPELSKTLMYDFHYNYTKKKFNSNLLFTDTDSLVYEVFTNDFYKEIKEDIKNNFDTSNYPKDHPSGIKLKNKKVLVLFKDEFGGKIRHKFVGLRSKLYSCKMYEGEELKKCKGLKKNIKKDLSFDEFKRCLNKKEKINKTMNVIRSRKHIVQTERVNKIALSYDVIKDLFLR